MKARLESITYPAADAVGLAQAARMMGLHHVALRGLLKKGIVRGNQTASGDWVVTLPEVLQYLATMAAPAKTKGRRKNN